MRSVPVILLVTALAGGCNLWDGSSSSDDGVSVPPPPEGRLASGVVAAVFDDPLYGNQWHLDDIALPQAWTLQEAISRGPEPVVVAVLDTGILFDHPDFAGRTAWIDGWDFIGNDSDPTDEGGVVFFSSSWHGTHVAGTIGAVSNNAVGITGIVPNDIAIMPVRVLSDEGGTTTTLAHGLLYALGLENSSGTVPSEEADVVNLSLGGAFDDPLVTDILDDAARSGVVVVAATGNDGTDTVSYPARLPTTLGVGAYDLAGGIAAYSNSGSGVDVLAPGGDTATDLNADSFADGVLSLIQPNPIREYAPYQGTSMAAPHVSGVVALAALAGSPNLDAVRSLIADSAGRTLPAGRGGAEVPLIDAAEVLYRWVEYGGYYRAVGGLGTSGVSPEPFDAPRRGAVRSAVLLDGDAGTGRFVVAIDNLTTADRTAISDRIEGIARGRFTEAQFRLEGPRFGTIDTGIARTALRAREIDLDGMIAALAEVEGVRHVYEERRYSTMPRGGE